MTLTDNTTECSPLTRLREAAICVLEENGAFASMAELAVVVRDIFGTDYTSDHPQHD